MAQRLGFGEAVARQAEDLEAARASIEAALAGQELPTWREGESVAAVSMGASSHAGHALLAALQRCGVRSQNLTASDFALLPPGFRPADHGVFISESGRSPEPIAAARVMAPGTRIGITNFPASPFAAEMDVVLPLGGFTDSGVYTIGYTATLLAFGLLLERQGLRPWEEDLRGIPAAVSGLTAGLRPAAAALAPVVGSAAAVDLVGRGVSFAAASEGALVLREALKIPAAAFETYQYLHGPMEGMAPGRAVVVFGDERELTLVAPLLAAGVRTVLVTTAAEDDVPDAGHEALSVVTLPACTGFTRAVLEILVVQRLVAEREGSVPHRIGEFRYRHGDTKLPED